jgi:16S rRNA (guanine527-N7)-methyltransferase
VRLIFLRLRTGIRNSRNYWPKLAHTGFSATQYCVELVRWSARMNLVSRRELQQLAVKHVAASMGVFLLEDPHCDERWVDVGSGGGFPGMVIKLCRPCQQITLMDASRKKAQFLEAVGKLLHLDDLTVVWARLEEHRPDGFATFSDGVEGAFSVVLMRSVAPLRESFSLIDPITSSGARFLTFKGPAWERELAAAGTELGRRGWAFDSMISIPWTMSRILKFTKI